MSDHSLGILIIGSLIWDSKSHRASWREKRLRVESGVPVQVPIRYGRKSDYSRDGTYTMVFSNELNAAPDRMGWGIVLPCCRTVKTTADLTTEAEELWVAEQPNKKDPGPLSGNWGAVALLAYPTRTGLEELIDGWANRIGKETGLDYANFPCSKNERPIIDENGLLTFDWPNDDSRQPLEFHLLLATATIPTLVDESAYALPKDVAEKWREHPSRLRYFDENRRAGITTSDDYKIIQHLGITT